MSFCSASVSLNAVFATGEFVYPSMRRVEKTRGGISLKRKMPTRIEDAGIRASAAGGEVKFSATASETSPLGGLFATITSMADEGADPQFSTPSNILDGEDVADLCMTRSILSRMPDINFKNPFLMQAPTSKDQVVYVAWGYKLRSMPSSQKGSAYADKYAVQLWAKRKEVRVHYPTIATSIGYKNKITTEYEQKATGNLVTTQRIDSREFQARFDEMKNFPIEFRLGGSAKSVDGDNHVAWLTLAILHMMALKQAQETNTRAHITMTAEIAKSFAINVEEMIVSRSSSAHSVATALANAWFGSAKPGGRPGSVEAVPAAMFDMVLPSNSGDAGEVVYLAYLSGMLDDSIRWRTGDEELDIQPMYSSIRSSATERMKIPLANATRAILMTELSKYDSALEVGRAEAVFNAYVRRFDLEKQVNVAKRLALLAMLDTHSPKGSRMLLGLPKPCHVMEYDLWVDPKHYSTSPIGLVTSSESAGLLMALSQMQATMRNDILVMKLVDHLESKGTPVLSALAFESLRDWIHDSMPSGFSSWARGWITSVTGSSPPELRRLANDSVHGFWSGLNSTLLSGTVHVSAMLYYGEKPRSGALRSIWEENLRVGLARQKFVTGPQSKVLRFLYSGKANIFDTNPTDWIHYLADFSKRRDTRKIDSSLGVRSTNTVTGEPRIIFLGLRPPVISYEERMMESQDAEGIATHYEPTFDFNNALAYSPATMPLGTQPKDGRHSSDSKFHTGDAPIPHARKRSDSVSRQLGPDKISPAGRLFSALFKNAIDPPKKDFLNNPHDGQPQRLFNQGGVGSVRGTYVAPYKDAKHNLLAETARQLKAESSARLEEIPDQLKYPAFAKGSEILEIGVEEAFDNIEAHFKRQDIEYTYAPLRAREYEDMSHHVDIQPVKGDGRCGARALQLASVVNGQKPILNLEEVFETEARIMGLKLSKRAPSTHMADDYSLASIAHAFGLSLCIVHYEGNVKRNQKGIRFYRPKNTKSMGVLFIILRNAHYDAIKLDQSYLPLTGAESAKEVQAWYSDSAELAKIRRIQKRSEEESSEPETDSESEPPQPAEKKRGGASAAKRENRKLARALSNAAEAEIENILEEAAKKRVAEEAQMIEALKSVSPEVPTHMFAYRSDEKRNLSELVKLQAEFRAQQAHRAMSELSRSTERAIEREAKRMVSQDQWRGVVTKYRVTDFQTQLPPSMSDARSINRYKLWLYLNDLPRVDDRITQAVATLALQAGTSWDYMSQDLPVSEHELMYYLVKGRISAVTLDVSAVYYGRQRMKKIVGYTTYDTGCSHGRNASNTVVFIRHDGHLCAPYIMRSSPDSVIRELKDISNFSKVDYQGAEAEPRSLAPTRTREFWINTVNVEIAKLGATSRKLQNLECDPEYWNKALTGRTCIGEDPDDTASNNIELLSCFADMLQCPDDVSFFRTEAVDWLIRLIGWVPEDQSWFGAETVMLLALHRDFRVWVLEDLDSLDRHNIVEHKLSHTQSTLPVIMSSTDGKVRLHQLNLPGRAGSSMENLALACQQHRHNGTYPEPGVPGPTLPTPQHPDDLKFKNKDQAYLLGWLSAVGSLVITAGTLVVAYKKRHQIAGLVRNVRDKWKGVSAYAASERSLQIASDREPLLGVQHTQFTDDTQPGPLSPDFAAYQTVSKVKDHLSDAGSIKSLRTVPLGGTEAITTSRWPNITILKRWWGTASDVADF